MIVAVAAEPAAAVASIPKEAALQMIQGQQSKTKGGSSGKWKQTYGVVTRTLRFWDSADTTTGMSKLGDLERFLQSWRLPPPGRAFSYGPWCNLFSCGHDLSISDLPNSSSAISSSSGSYWTSSSSWPPSSSSSSSSSLPRSSYIEVTASSSS